MSNTGRARPHSSSLQQLDNVNYELETLRVEEDITLQLYSEYEKYLYEETSCEKD